MRKAQIDAGSQPVRNLFANPGSELAPGIANVRTNVVANPSMETAGSVIAVRTNLALNPNAASTTSWSNIGGTAHTRTLDTTIFHSGNSGVRATLTAAGGLGLKCAISGGITTGETVSWSVWVYPSVTISFQPWWERSSPTYSGSSAGGAISCPAETWTKLTGTYTFDATRADPTGSFGFGFYSGGSTFAIGDWFTADELIVEKLPLAALSEYFDGNLASAGDFNYSWTGTANASASNQLADQVHNRQNANPNSKAWQSALRARTGTKSAAILCTAVINTSTTLWYPATEYVVGTGTGQLAANTIYTWSAYVWVPSSASPGVIRLMESNTNVAGASSTLYDQWERLSVTFTTPASGNSLLRIRGMGGTTIPAGTIIYVDDELLEPGSVAQPYFSGDSAAAGDYTYLWDSTVNNSVSRQRSATPLKIGTLNATPVSSTEWSAGGTKSTRIVPYSSSADSFGFLTLPVTLKTGETYTVLATCRLAAPQTGNIDATRSRRIVAYHSNAVSYSNQAANVAGVTQLRLTFKCLDATQYQNIRLYNGTSAGNGDVWFDNIMFVEGDYQGDYIDGTKPFSKWTGAVNDSTSVGYPPQLYDIAGKPVLDLTAIGVTVLDDSFAPTEPRTIYTAYQTMTVTPPQTSIVLYGLTNLGDSPANGTMTLRLQSSGTTFGAINRRTAGAGPAQYNIPFNAASVSVWGMNSDGIQFIQNNNAATLISTQVMSVPHQHIAILPEAGFHRHHRTLIYRGIHDSTTRAAISRYLGNKYGAYVA